MDLELQELQQTCGSLGLRAHQDLLAHLAHPGLRVLLEPKDHRVSLETTGYGGNRVCLDTAASQDHSSFLETLLEEMGMWAVKMGTAP